MKKKSVAIKKLVSLVLGLVLLTSLNVPVLGNGENNDSAIELYGRRIDNVESHYFFAARINDDWNYYTNPIGTQELSIFEGSYGNRYIEHGDLLNVIESEFIGDGSWWHFGEIVFASSPVTITNLWDITDERFEWGTFYPEFWGFGYPLTRRTSEPAHILDMLLAREIPVDGSRVPLAIGGLESVGVGILENWTNEDGTWADEGVPVEVEELMVPAGSAFVLQEPGIYILTMSSSTGPLIIVVDGDSSLLTQATSEQTTSQLPMTDDTTPNLSTASNWAHENITQAFTQDLIPQALQNHYAANATRAEFANLAVTLYENVAGREIAITREIAFNDTNDINVHKAAYIGVVQGVGNGNFAPNAGLTREQAAVMITRLAEAVGHPLPASAPTFADNAQISSWAFDAVGQVQAAGLMGGMGNNLFDPSGDYTREQSIITMLRLFQLL